jgi:peptidoglycan hydrolase CwlO-like protein
LRKLAPLAKVSEWRNILVLEFSLGADILRRMHNAIPLRKLFVWLALVQLVASARPAFSAEQEALQGEEKALQREEYVLQDDIARLSNEIEQRQKRLDEAYRKLKRIRQDLNQVSKELSVSSSSWNN